MLKILFCSMLATNAPFGAKCGEFLHAICLSLVAAAHPTDVLNLKSKKIIFNIIGSMKDRIQ